MRIFHFLFAASALLCAGQARAYGPTGHQVVGAIADRRLAGTPTGRKVAELLDGFTLQKAAVIPDEIKGWDKNGADDPDIFHYSSRPRIDEQLRAFWRANPPTTDPHSTVPSHHWFHYTDVPVLNPEKYRDGKIGRSEWDIVHMMRHCIAVLRGEEPEENARKITRPIAIILLAHYAGDIHQPLHVGAEYFDAAGRPVDPEKGVAGIEDQGGNTIMLQIPGGKKKLHGFWDNDAVAAFLPLAPNALPKEERRESNDKAMKELVDKLAAQEPRSWRLPASVKPNDYPEGWADEILPVAREAHERLQFIDVRVTEVDGQTLAAGTAIEKAAADKVSYRNWASGIVREELHKAGWRLADLLEKTLGSASGAAQSSPSLSASPSSVSSPSAAPPDSSPNDAASSPTVPAPALATITKPVTVRVPYGSVQLSVGMKLPYSMRGDKTVRVRYMGADYEVPIASTDLPQ